MTCVTLSVTALIHVWLPTQDRPGQICTSKLIRVEHGVNSCTSVRTDIHIRSYRGNGLRTLNEIRPEDDCQVNTETNTPNDKLTKPAYAGQYQPCLQQCAVGNSDTAVGQ